VRVCIPEICDYELRREYYLNNNKKSLQKLDELKDTVQYIPITTDIMLNAAQLWAQARKEGHITADKKALDGDVILAAQARASLKNTDELIVATTNIGHLAFFVTAKLWEDI